jgi:MraZ protein
MFRGTQKGSVDSKGRLKLPVIAKRRLLDRYGEMDIFVTSLDGVMARIYPIREWEKVEAVLSQRSSGPDQAGDGRRKKKLMFVANDFGSEERVDRQGRLLVPARLRDTSDLKGAVKIQWQSSHMLVMSEAKYNTEVEANKLTAADFDFAADLGL